MLLRRIVLAAVAAGVLVISAGAAQAGGSWLEPSWQRVDPGDEVRLSAVVERGQLGWVDDGPYYAYLQGDTYGTLTEEGLGGAATDVRLGQLTLDERSQYLSVSVDVVIPPATPPGEYWIRVCNDPCTTGLGDLIGGVLYVGIDPPPEAATAVAVVDTTTAPTETTTYLALAPATDRSINLSLWIGMSVALGSAVLLVSVVTYRR